MAERRKKRVDSKNRKLEEFLTKIEVGAEKKDQILEFVEKLAFEKVKEASIKHKPKAVLRLKR